MFIRSINHVIPLPGPRIPPNGNGGIVPPSLVKDLGHEATHPTVPGHAGWWVNFKK